MASAAPDLITRAAALSERSDYAGVVQLLESLESDVLLGEPELGYHLAYAWRRVGRTDAAYRLARALDVPVRRRAEARLVRRRLNLEAMLCFDRGNVPFAEDLWSRVAELAAADGDAFLLAAAYNNLGVIQTLQDRMDEAVGTYTRALLASRQLGDRRGIAQAHQNLGILFRERALPHDAESHFRDAMTHARASDSEDVLGRAEEERALLLLDQGDAQLAHAAATRALERLEALRDVGGAGEALRVLGIIALHERRRADAAQALSDARARARSVHNPLLEAEVLEATALLGELEGDAAGAEQAREEAGRLFAHIAAEPWGRRIRARTAELAALAR